MQTVLGHLLHNASTLNTSQVNTSNHKESCENVVGCRNGWHYGPMCQDGDNALHCAVLLADFPGLSLLYFRHELRFMLHFFASLPLLEWKFILNVF